MNDGVMQAATATPSAAREPVLRISNGSKIYGGVHAIEGVNFDLYPGEVHALVGENGAGKSTLCKAIAGAINLTSGDYLLDGKPAADVEISVIPGGNRYRDELGEIKAKTDKDGKVSITWPEAGMYWMEAELTTDKGVSKPATERRASYSATLEVLAP